MGGMGVGSRVGQLNQWSDEDIRVRSRQGSFPTEEEAQARAAEVAESPTEDAIVTRANGQYNVYGVSEIGTLDPSANEVGRYDIHELEGETIVSFDITKRDTEGERLGGQIHQEVSGDQADVRFSANRSENGIVQVGRNTRNFMDYLNPLDSGGDNINMYIEGEAGVSWGWGGVEVEGGANISASRGDDGAYYLSVGANAGASGTLGRDTPAGGVEGSLGVGAQASATYRFRNAQEANDFLVYQIRENMPGATQMFPQLDNARDMSHVGPITSIGVSGTASLEGSLKLGAVDLEGSAEFTAAYNRVTYPDGSQSNNWSAQATVNVEVSSGDVGVALNASVNRYSVEQHPTVPENAGEYIAANGQLTLTLSESQVRGFTQGQNSAVVGPILQAGTNLGLSGNGLASFQEAMISQVENSINNETYGRSSGGSVSIGLAVQAQWEIQNTETDGLLPESELQYVRVGVNAETRSSVGADAGFASFEVRAGVSRTDLTEVATGTGDITYLQGLFFENRAEYNQIKAQAGGSDLVVQGQTLAQWEQQWSTRSGATYDARSNY